MEVFYAIPQKGQRKVKAVLNRTDAHVKLVDIASGETIAGVMSLASQRMNPHGLPVMVKVTLEVDQIEMEGEDTCRQA